MKSKFITLQLGIKKNKTDGLLISLTDNNNTQIISTLNKFAAAPIIISKKIFLNQIQNIFLLILVMLMPVLEKKV